MNDSLRQNVVKAIAVSESRLCLCSELAKGRHGVMADCTERFLELEDLACEGRACTHRRAATLVLFGVEK